MSSEREIFTLSAAPENLVEMTRTLQGTIAMVEQLRGGMGARGRPGEISQLIDALIRGLPYQGYLPSEDFSLWRGRIDNNIEFFKAPAEFGYCPLEKATTWGRCARPGTTIFYGAFNLNTVWAELYPAIGDRVHLAHVRRKKHTQFTVSEIGGLDYCRRFGRSMLSGDAGYQVFNNWLNAQTPEEAMRATLVDAYFADEFSKVISRPRDYLITATMAGLLLDATNVDGLSLLDGFAYPSVAHRGGVNFGIHPKSFDEKMEWHQFLVAEITQTLGYGIYAYREIAKAEAPSNGEPLNWINAFD